MKKLIEKAARAVLRSVTDFPEVKRPQSLSTKEIGLREKLKRHEIYRQEIHDPRALPNDNIPYRQDENATGFLPISASRAETKRLNAVCLAERRKEKVQRAVVQVDGDWHIQS